MTRRAGFTLIEIAVALTLGSMAVLLAAQTFASVTETAQRLRSERDTISREMNGRRWLSAALASTEVGSGPEWRFDGTADELRFGSWQLTGDGWFERRHVEVSADGRRLTARVGDDVVLLADNVTYAAFDYLVQPGADTPWRRDWHSNLVAPVAVRLRLGRREPEGSSTIAADTMLFAIRGHR